MSLKAIQGMATELKLPVSRCERFEAAEGVPAPAAASTALALCHFHPALAPLDLLHSRLAAKQPPKVSSRTAWALVSGVVLLLCAAYLIGDWRQTLEEVSELRQKRNEMKESIETAKGFISRVNGARTWYERRPNYLECLRTITLCFPEEGRAWTSSLTLREDMRGILTGRASDEKSVLDVLDRLKSSPALTNVKMLQMRGAGTKSPELSFGISFVFRGPEERR